MSLERLKQELKAAMLDPQDEAAFHRLVNETMDALHLQDEDIAREFGMTRSTATRWMDGTAVPHPAMRPPVYRTLALLVTEALSVPCNCDDPTDHAHLDHYNALHDCFWISASTS